MSSDLMPPKGWIVSDAQSYCTKIADGTHDSPKQSAIGNLLVTSKNIIDGELDLSKSYFISEEDYSKINRRSKVDKNDVLLSMIGTVGQACVVEQEPNFAIKNVGLLKNDDPIKAKWLYFYLSSPKAQQLIKERLKGTTQQYLSLGEIRKLPVFYPESHDVMKRVVYFLDSLRKKNIINNSVSRTLEQMAQALFKSWFVDFEPVKAKIAVLEAGGSLEEATLAAMTAISGKDADLLVVFEREYPEQYAELKATAELFPSAMQESELGEIPEGWKVSSLEDVTSLIIDHRGKTPKKLGGDWSEEGHPAISAKNIKNGRLVRHDTIRYVDSNLYAKWMKDPLLAGDILMTSEAPLGELLYLVKDCDYLLSQRLYGIRADKEIISGCYLYFWLQTNVAKTDIDGRATGSTVVGIRQSELKKIIVMAPQKTVVESFSKLTALYLAKIDSNEKQNTVLENLRDTLLPKLLSGEITLPEAEQAVSEVENV
ncbi:restriction endonuclease subunit S [Escherichia coli]|nr:restriction endonuclease subunit S [Escherichia coli]